MVVSVMEIFFCLGLVNLINLFACGGLQHTQTALKAGCLSALGACVSGASVCAENSLGCHTFLLRHFPLLFVVRSLVQLELCR